MTYVDVFVAAVPKANRDAYIAHAEIAKSVFMENGALSYRECWGVDVPEGRLTSLPLAVLRKDDEDVVVGWCEWPSKDMRDAGMQKIFTDPRMDMKKAPFDGERMIFGGFEPVVVG